MEDPLKKILKKIDALELRINKIEGRRIGPAIEAEGGEEYNYHGEEEVPNKFSQVQAPAAVPQKTEAAPKRQFSEAQIGKEWFNKIGAVSIIIGVVLFIGYTFQYLGPLGKIAIGYLVSIGLISLGLFLSKKYKNYSNGLLAIGWAMSYFTTFATYYIETSQIIFNANLCLLLLFVVSGAMAIFSCFYESEEFSIIAVSLGALSAIIGNVPFISLLAVIILIVYSVVVAIYKNWATLAFFSIIASYLTYRIALARQEIFTHEFFQIGSLFLIAYFILFVLASFFVNSGKYERGKYVISLIAVNIFSFFILFIDQLYLFYPDADGYFTGLLGIILLYIAGSSYSLAREKKYLYTTYGWLGWGFITLAIPLQLVGSWIAGAWLVEGAALLIIGLLRNKKSFIYVGFITLALFLFRFATFDLLETAPVSLLSIVVKSRVIFSIFTVFVFFVIALVWDKIKERVVGGFNQVIFLPSLIAAGIFMISISLDANKNFISLWFLLEGLIIYTIGLLSNRVYLRMISLLPMAGFGLMWLGYDSINQKFVNQEIFGDLNYRAIVSLIAAPILYSLYAIAWSFSANLKEGEKNIRDIFVVAASVIIVALTFFEVNTKLITVALSLEGTLILAVGFMAKKKILRLIGMVVLLVAILRIFIIDLSFLETIYRIISFVVLGAILMGISFIYTKYKDKIL